jgi:hypothetical protein
MDWRETLKAVAIPAELAEESNQILQKQAENPFYERTQEEQKIIDKGYQILIRGMIHQEVSTEQFIDILFEGGKTNG